jgi:hypothetical protein
MTTRLGQRPPLRRPVVQICRFSRLWRYERLVAIGRHSALRIAQNSWWVVRRLGSPKRHLFLNFLQAAETDAEFRAEIPAFVGGIKSVFETWQLAEYLEVARQSEPFDPSLYEPLDEEEAADIDLEEAEELRQDDLRRSAEDMLLVEQARAWLLEEGD